MVESCFRLGRIAGVEVGVNWSWLVVFALITWSLAAGVFPDQDPGGSQAPYIVMAVIGAGLFFASVLAHELGHAVTARREGMQLDGITLWLFGGVARFKGRFPSAEAEVRIAIAGPAVSLVIGVVCPLLAWAVALPGSVDGVLAWIGYINLILLVFNLLPAFPLDGGRVLRALLWAAKADFAWATSVAATMGRGFGYLLCGGGIGLFVFQGAFGGAWPFRRVSSVSRDQWDARSVRSCMIPAEEVPTLHPGAAAIDALVELSESTANRGVVVDQGRLVGVLSAADLGRALEAGPRRRRSAPGGESMAVSRGADRRSA
jgi:Zn-dependent protease